MIQNIEISCLRPHKDNPRKDLGDVTELAESIKATGILQNLTVVPYVGELTKQPWEGMYTVVIGHRRLAAAKLAGLTEVPCAISNMDYKEQIATMLTENMQRSDLTIYEQAEGFQMMLDLGESVNDISRKTGFSDTTVRRRVKLLELDRDKLKASVSRGATLMDYVELEKIKDVDVRNKVLESVGTNNFRWQLQNALDKDKDEENKEFIIAELKKFATEVEKPHDYTHVKRYYPWVKPLGVEVPKDADTTQYFFFVSPHGPIGLLKKNDSAEIEAEKDNAIAEQRKQLDYRRECLKDVTKQAAALRHQFMRELSNNMAARNIKEAIVTFFEVVANQNYITTSAKNIADYLNVELTADESGETNYDEFNEEVRDTPELAMLFYIYTTLDNDGGYHNWDCKYYPNDRLDKIYDLLEKLGYEMSDAEIALKNGTHSLFLTKEKE